MKIVATGLGLISAAGINEKETLESFSTGTRHAAPVSLFASEIKAPVFEVRDFSRDYFPERLRTLNLCLSAVEDALINAGLQGALKGKRVGVAMGTTIGSILNDFEFYKEYREKGKAPMDAVNCYLQGNLASAVHLFLGTDGPFMTVVNACASSSDAIGIAMSWLKAGLCDIAIAGGSDEMSRIPLCGFNSLGILSSTLSSPFDRDRNGLNLGEGAAAFVLENETSFRQRGVKARAVISGFGTANDAYHLTSPDPQGAGLEKAVTRALEEAGLKPSDITFINAHGTGTHDNDAVEGLILHKIFGPKIKFLSTKGYTGHTLGAAGGLEAGFSLLALEKGWIPASAGFKNQDSGLSITPVTERTPVEGRFALSTSLGFGGCNAALVIELPEKKGSLS